SRMAEVAQAFRCCTSYTSSRSLYDLIVLITLSALAADISPLEKTSKPRRSGTRTRAILINSGFPFGFSSTSLINSLAALLPISMAASLNLGQCFFKQIIIDGFLRPDLFPSAFRIFILQHIIQYPCFCIILQLYV